MAKLVDKMFNRVIEGDLDAKEEIVSAVNQGIESGEISAGAKLYKHSIYDAETGYDFALITDSPIPLDFTTLNTQEKIFNYLKTINVISFKFGLDNVVYDESNNYFNYIRIYAGTLSGSLCDDWELNSTTDTVTEL